MDTKKIVKVSLIILLLAFDMWGVNYLYNKVAVNSVGEPALPLFYFLLNPDTYFGENVVGPKKTDTTAQSEPIGEAPSTGENLQPSSEQEVPNQTPVDPALLNTKIQESAFGLMASSALSPEGNITYSAENILDSDVTTTWTEGVEGQGLNEWLDFNFQEPQMILQLTIYNGYGKSKKLYTDNSRVRDYTLFFDGGHYVAGTLQDVYGEYQTIKLEQPVSTKTIRFMVKSVYPGEKYKDTCISEIEIYGAAVAALP